VEVGLGAAERKEIRRRFEDSPVKLAGLGSAFEYHAADPAALKQNIEGTKEYVRLARDVGAPGVKVRPNGFPEGVPRERTIEQIGRSLRECGAFAKDCGVQIRLEVHGRETCVPAHIRAMMDAAAHDNVFVCWNSNATDVIEGSVRRNFDLLKDRISLVHINELHAAYPWRELFHLLRWHGYGGYCLAEIPGSPDAERLMRYYRALFNTLCE
jgi:sugar phosphate isomerase/epimerase